MGCRSVGHGAPEASGWTWVPSATGGAGTGSTQRSGPVFPRDSALPPGGGGTHDPALEDLVRRSVAKRGSRGLVGPCIRQPRSWAGDCSCWGPQCPARGPSGRFFARAPLSCRSQPRCDSDRTGHSKANSEAVDRVTTPGIPPLAWSAGIARMTVRSASLIATCRFGVICPNSRSGFQVPDPPLICTIEEPRTFRSLSTGCFDATSTNVAWSVRTTSGQPCTAAA